MDLKSDDKTIRSLGQKQYKVSVFDSAAAAADYLDVRIDGTTIGFGDSQTIKDMNLYERLSSHNTVYDPRQSDNSDSFVKIAQQSLGTDVYITSVNSISETGEMVNIDGTGNRIAGSLFGHEKVFFVVSTDKIEQNLEKAVWRARNIAAPKNALKYDLPTPCVIHYNKTGELKCFDCDSPERICNSINIYLKKMNDTSNVEVVLIREAIGF